MSIEEAYLLMKCSLMPDDVGDDKRDEEPVSGKRETGDIEVAF